MNIIIASSKWEEHDKELLFQEEPVQVIDADSLDDLCVKVGAYPSKSKARQAGRFGEIPKGWSDALRLSKTKVVWIWNPPKYTKEYE